MPRLRSLLVIAVMLSVAATFAACNTVGGAGKDISAGGEAISDTAKKASDAL